MAVAAMATSAQPASAAGPCFGNNTGQNQLFVDKMKSEISGASYFDAVRGDATVAPLDICIGAPANYGGSFVLPANVQNDANQRIFQLGYGQSPGESKLYFVYVDGDAISRHAPTGTWGDPTIGSRYRFSITRESTSSGYRPMFQITDLTDGGSIFWYGNVEFGKGMDRTWWGYESLDQASSMGPLYGNGDVNMAYMGYSTEDGGWVYRSGLTNSYGDRPQYPNRMHKHVSFSDPLNARSGHIGDWVYGGDKFNVHTH